MVWGCMSAAGTGEHQFIEGTMNAKISSQVTFIYIVLLTIQIVSKQLHNIKIGK